MNSDIQNTVRIRLVNIRGFLEIGLNEVAEMETQSNLKSEEKNRLVRKKVKEADLYSAFIEVPYTQGAQARIAQCYLQLHRTCLYLVSIHQMAHPQTEVLDI